jgi:superfamily II helicase
MRPLCSCGVRPKAVNYHKNGKTFYRKLCNICLKNGNAGLSRWYRSGYRVKQQCDKCGFKSMHSEVFTVFHVDGDLNNCRVANLKTVCANCARVLHKEGVRWRQGDLVPDL